MCNNRREINYLGRVTKNKRPIHPIVTDAYDVTIKFEWADPFAGWTGETMLENFSWQGIVPAMDAVCKRYAPDMRASLMSDKEHCPLMAYSHNTRTLTIYFTSNPDTADKLLRYTMIDDITATMSGDFNQIDNLKDAYIVRVITHKSALNSGRPNHYKIHAGETKDDFLHRISDSIAEKGYTRMFTEVVYGYNHKPTLYFWVYKPAAIVTNHASAMLIPDGYIDTDTAAARKAEITQLMLSSKCYSGYNYSAVIDFLCNAEKTMLKPGGTIGDVSDGYHTFNELYHHRAILFATLCNLMPDLAWKSKQHDDPNFPMYDGMFICGIVTPMGQATYHYDIDPYWDLFKVKELERAPKYDGHTPADAIQRIYHIAGTPTPRVNRAIHYHNKFTNECDSYLLDSWKKSAEGMDIHTEFYIDGCDMISRSSYIVPFRYPGATRGHVKVHVLTGLVEEIKFYNTAYEDKGIACYKPDISALVLRWEGGNMSQLVNMCKRVLYGWEVSDDTGIPAHE